MGVDTRGVILTDKREFWYISQRIGNSIYKMIKERAPVWQTDHDIWSYPELTIMHSFHSLTHPATEYFKLHFNYGGEERMLHVHTDCDCDLKEEFGEDVKGIILSFGMWGSAVEIMERVLKDLSDLGHVYIMRNDCEDDYEELI